MAVRIPEKDLGFFATLDEGILEQSRGIREFLGCLTVRPSELVRLEDL